MGHGTGGSALVDTLIELMELPGHTGQEEPVLAWCRRRWGDLGADVRSTPIGNVVAHVVTDCRSATARL